MKVHRAVVLVAMMLLGVGLLVMLTVGAVQTFDSHSLIALGVVIVAAAAGGVAFSWGRYFKRSPRAER